MSNFKIGDEFEVLSNGGRTNGVNPGDHVFFISFEDDGCHKFQSTKNGKIVYFFEESVKKIKGSGFKTSNRYKLHKYILSTGFTKQDLSLALNKNQSYLATETRESQFINRGDMSDARYKFLRKQIKEAVYKITIEFANSVPTNVGISGGEVTKTILEVEPKEKVNHKKLEVNINGQVFDFLPDESVSIEITKKPSNNGAFILGLVFFVLLIIFGIGCLIYKAA